MYVPPLQWANHAWSDDGTIAGDNNTFTVVEGNCGAGTVSFRSDDHPSVPGTFFRHRTNGVLELSSPDDSPGAATFAMDSSFMARPGIKGGVGAAAGTVGAIEVSIRSVSNPHKYVRHKNGVLRIDAFTNTAAFTSDATFVAATGQAVGGR